jgi:hypothetical protein
MLLTKPPDEVPLLYGILIMHFDWRPLFLDSACRGLLYASKIALSGGQGKTRHLNFVINISVLHSKDLTGNYLSP